jgi:hypothetical protein
MPPPRAPPDPSQGEPRVRAVVTGGPGDDDLPVLLDPDGVHEIVARREVDGHLPITAAEGCVEGAVGLVPDDRDV